MKLIDLKNDQIIDLLIDRIYTINIRMKAF